MTDNLFSIRNGLQTILSSIAALDNRSVNCTITILRKYELICKNFVVYYGFLLKCLKAVHSELLDILAFSIGLFLFYRIHHHMVILS